MQLHLKRPSILDLHSAYEIFPSDSSTFVVMNVNFPKDLEDSRQVKILKKTTTLLNLQNMFRQKLLSSAVDRFTKR